MAHSLRIPSLILSIELLVLYSVPASAQAWEVRPGGGVWIDMKGIRLALPADGPDIRYISFGFYRSGPDWQDYRSLHLSDVLERPDETRRTFDQIETASIAVSKGGLLLRPYEADWLSNVSLSVGGRQGNCHAWASDYARLRASARDTSLKADEHGWIIAYQDKRSPPSTLYIRFEKNDDREHSQYIALSCSPTFGYCSRTVCLKKDLSVSLELRGADYGFGKPLQTARFTPALRAAARVLSQIAPDLDVSDLAPF